MKKPISSHIKKVGCALKKASPMILTILGAAGTVATAVLAVKATPKAVQAVQNDSKANHGGDPDAATKAEAVKSAWKYYIPAAAAGTAAILCMFGANLLNRRQQVSLASAYALLNHSYSDYKRKVNDIYGPEAHERILRSLADENVDKNHTIYAPTPMRDANLDFEDADEEEHLFYDAFSERYFTSSFNKVLQAEYHLNRNFELGGGEATVNEFYNLLGLRPIDGGNEIGWFVNDATQWIDFNHTKTQIDDGVSGNYDCWIIEMVFTPGTYDEYCK